MPALVLRRGRAVAIAVLALLALVFTGCSAEVWEGVAAGLAAAAEAQAASSRPTGPSEKLMLFGGPGHDTYLGCISCSSYEPDSVQNSYGAHGSSYSTASIFNRYGQYGSSYSMYSPCSPYASDPPVIVDGAGNFYGRLTINQYHPQRTSTRELLAWIAGVCSR